MKSFAPACSFLILLVLASCQGRLKNEISEPTRWRGPNGNGIYPDTGLLKEWPAEGPEILWSYDSLGSGFSSAVVRNGSLFITGMIDSTGYLYKFDLGGGLKYKIPYGPEFTKSFPGTRGSPVVVGDRVYLVSSMGKLVCFNNDDGKIVWSKDLFTDFDGGNIMYGLNETPVVDGEVIFATPGGELNNVVALNRHSGELIWNCPGKGELSANCTPLLFTHNGRKILTTHTASHFIGIDAGSGELLWAEYQPNEFSIHSNTPIYHGGEVYYLTGSEKGGGKLKLSDDGNTVSVEWNNQRTDGRIGGAVLVDGYVYESFERIRECRWRIIDWETGEEQYLSGPDLGLGPGNVIWADGMLYIYTIRGQLALVKPGPSGMENISMTNVTLGSAQHRAYIMIDQGVLYLRRGSALIAYQIKEDFPD